MTVNVDAGLCTKVVEWTIPTATDNCGTPTVIANANEEISSPEAGKHQATIAVGTSTISYVATDSNGNEQTCSFTITVQDDIAPVLACPPGSSVFCAENAPVYANYTEFTAALGTASDNCSLNLSSFAKLADVLSGTTLIRNYQIADAAGNTSTCSQTFAIEQPTIVISSQNTTTCIGGDFTITDHTAYSGNVNRQWQKRTNSSFDWSDIVGESGVTYDGILGSFSEEYRLLVSQNLDFDGSCVPASLPLVFSDTQAPVFQTAFAPQSKSYCTLPGQSSAAVSGLEITALDVIDNCTLDLLSALSYTITGAGATSLPASGVNLPDPAYFNEGVSVITYIATDAAGNSAQHVVEITVQAAPAPISIAYGMNGATPSQCATYNYSVDAALAEPGFTYSWNVYSGNTATGTPIQSFGNVANISISWSPEMVPGFYTVEVIKTAGNSCESKDLLLVDLQNSFDLQVLGPTTDCKEQAQVSYSIGWTVEKLCGPDSWNFTWYLFEGILTGLPADYTNPAVYKKTGDFTSGTLSKSFEIAVDNADEFNETGYTLFILNTQDSNPSNDFNYFYLHGIPNTSEIATD